MQPPFHSPAERRETAVLELLMSDANAGAYTLEGGAVPSTVEEVLHSNAFAHLIVKLFLELVVKIRIQCEMKIREIKIRIIKICIRCKIVV